MGKFIDIYLNILPWFIIHTQYAYNMNIHYAIHQVILEKKLTISDISKESGLTRSYIYKVLSGRHSPTIYTLCRFADALEIPLSLLIMVAEGESIE